MIVHWTLTWLILLTLYRYIDCDRYLTWFDIWFCIDWLYCSLFIFHMLYLSYSSTVYHYVHTVYMREHLPFFLSHSLGRFPMTIDLYVQVLDVLYYWSGVRLRLDMLWEVWSFSLFDSGIIVFLFIHVFIVSMIPYTIRLIVIPFLYSYNIMCGHPYVVL